MNNRSIPASLSGGLPPTQSRLLGWRVIVGICCITIVISALGIPEPVAASSFAKDGTAVVEPRLSLSPDKVPDIPPPTAQSHLYGWYTCLADHADAPACRVSRATDWTVVTPVSLDGPARFWHHCPGGAGSGDGTCHFTYATGGEGEATNCASWETGERFGEQFLYAYVPAQAATATVTYRIRVERFDGSSDDYAVTLDQAEHSGWTHLLYFRTDAPRVLLSVCDNEAYPHHGDDFYGAQIGVDAMAMACPACSIGYPHIPQWLYVDTSSQDTVDVTWEHTTETQFGNHGYLVTYRELVEGDGPLYGIAYYVSEPVHSDVRLTPGGMYQVEVQTIDGLGDLSEPAMQWFVVGGWEPPPPGLLERVGRFLRGIADTCGYVDPTFACDGFAAFLSLLLGESDQAALSAAGMIPYVGDTAKAAGKASKRINNLRQMDLFENAPTISKKFNSLRNQTRKVVRKLDEYAKYSRKANDRFSVDEFTYMTDSLKRIKRVESRRGGIILGTPPESQSFKRGVRDRMKPLMRDGDQAGHLGPDAFRGRYQPFNVVPQAKRVNGEINAQLESFWRKCVRRGHRIDIVINVIYLQGNPTERPDAFEVSWKLDGEEIAPARLWINTNDVPKSQRSATEPWRQRCSS